MMGSGKTTIGRLLAARLDWPYADNDTLVERVTGRTAKALLSAGVSELRRGESAALAEVLQIQPPLVAALPGGVVEDVTDLARLRQGGYIVWLRATIATLVDRLGDDVDRPWLQPDPAVALRRLYAGREQLYATAAHLILDVDRATPEGLVDRIITSLTARPAQRPPTSAGT